MLWAGREKVELQFCGSQMGASRQLAEVADHGKLSPLILGPSGPPLVALVRLPIFLLFPSLLMPNADINFASLGR